jgi:hypothetical protein
VAGLVRSRVPHRERRWTTAEDDLIRKHYPDNGASELARMIGCYPSLVRNRARWLGVSLKATARKKARAEQLSKIGEAQTRHNNLRASAPKFLAKHEEYSRSWYLAQQHAFSEAMKNNPTERPS